MPLDRSVLAKKRKAIRDGFSTSATFKDVDKKEHTCEGIPCTVSADRIASMYGTGESITGSIKILTEDCKKKPLNGGYITVDGTQFLIRGIRPNPTGTAWHIDYGVRK